MSDPGRAKQVLDLCDEALMLGPEGRERFLDIISESDSELGESVRALLQAVDDSGSFMVVDDLSDE